MATIVAKARGDDADFVIREVHGLDLVYHKMRTGALQLVLPQVTWAMIACHVRIAQLVVFCALACVENHCRIAVLLLVA